MKECRCGPYHECERGVGRRDDDANDLGMRGGKDRPQYSNATSARTPSGAPLRSRRESVRRLTAIQGSRDVSWAPKISVVRIIAPMGLQAGERLGPYEIISLLGAGGMGEVYRARDTRLDRSVAVKVLAPELAKDPEFTARFTREAKAISALSHAHICALHDIGREHDIEYLVLELLDGETLAARLARGPLPLGQVLRFGVEIADALEAAHRLGIVHRDLKPGNVMLTPAGAKLLDFGLAKHTVGAAGQALSMLATAPGTTTAQGTLVGTLQYMAPEQVQGQPADARTDIFALGTLLYEMATGRRAFEATTQASLIAKILETEPPVVSSLAPLTPPALDHVVQGCLAKAPADRWQTAHDVKMQTAVDPGAGLPHRAGSSSGGGSEARWPGCRGSSLAAMVCTALVATALLRSSRPAITQTPVRFDLVLPAEMRQMDFNRGRDFTGWATIRVRSQRGWPPPVGLRDMASTGLVVLAGTEGGFGPFWSSDSRSIAFFSLNGRLKQLKRIPATGGPVRVICDTPSFDPSIPTDGTWRGGVILFATRRSHFPRRRHGRHGHRSRDASVEAGTEAIRVGAVASRWPSPAVQPSRMTPPCMARPSMLPAPGKFWTRALPRRYAAGHVFYARGAGLFARPFDPERLEVSGAEVQIADRAGFADGRFLFRVRRWHGRLPPGKHRRVEADVVRPQRPAHGHAGRAGAVWPGGAVAAGPARHGRAVRCAGDHGDLWDVDLASGIFSRLTTDPADDTDPSWSPDERALAFVSERTGRARRIREGSQ